MLKSRYLTPFHNIILRYGILKAEYTLPSIMVIHAIGERKNKIWILLTLETQSTGCKLPGLVPFWVQGLHNVNLLEDLGGLEIPGLPAHSRSGDSSPWNTILLQGWVRVTNIFLLY